MPDSTSFMTQTLVPVETKQRLSNDLWLLALPKNKTKQKTYWENQNHSLCAWGISPEKYKGRPQLVDDPGAE